MIRVSIIFVLACATTTAQELPTRFDTRDKWAGCGETVVDQGQCGSCWAASAASVFGDRLCIWFTDEARPISGNGQYNGNRLFQKPGTCSGVGSMDQPHRHGCKRTSMFVSPQPLISCGTYLQDSKLYGSSAGCNGGEAVDAWRYFLKEGLSEMTADGLEGCTPNTSAKCKAKDPNNNGCRSCTGVVDQCADSGLKPRLFKAGSFGHIMDAELQPRGDTSKPRPPSEQEAVNRQVKNMQLEILRNGPIHVCIDYFDNFGDFFNDTPLGIYNSTDSKPKSGGHCLNMIGWGHDEISGLDFWLIKNSWGSGWGDQGVFRMVRGRDFCGVESDVWAGCPMRSSCELTEGVHQKGYMPGRRLSASVPVSQQWPGGKWIQISKEHFNHFRLKIAHAYETVFGEPTTPEIAMGAVSELWTQGGVKGTKVRVHFEGKHVVAHHHSHDGIASFLHLDSIEQDLL